MDGGTATVIAAVIGGPLVTLLVRFEKRNTSQHGENMKVLREIKGDVKQVRSDVADLRERHDHHIDWHAHKD